MSGSKDGGRARSGIQRAIGHLVAPPLDHRLSVLEPSSADRNRSSSSFKASGQPPSPIDDKPVSLPDPPHAAGSKPMPKATKELAPHEQPSKGFLDDLVTWKWMRVPTTSLKMILAVYILWSGWLVYFPTKPNPLDRLVKISYPLPKELGDNGVQRYDKGWHDYYFVGFHIVVCAFIRQAFVEWLFRPLAPKLGIKGEGKTLRFMEQGYALTYWGTMTILGIYTMRELPTWFYKTEEFWKGYPHWRMTGHLKTYYLFQLSYWLQQLLVLTLRIEAPRSDFVELCIHHCVTLWLIGWSYTVNLTYIGVAIFVTMDVADAWLALSKCLNYTRDYKKLSEPVFVVFLAVWTYSRHWLNLVMLWSVWNEFDLAPSWARKWNPARKAFLPDWMQWQVFTPIFLLQLLNLFCIWRILIRILLGQGGKDTREEGEDDD